MKTSKNFKKIVGGSMAAATLAGGAMLAQAPAVSASSDWDRLAQCESGGNWSINTGNGFYGGLQFMKATWDSMGGQQYAEYPHQASKSQQIAVASKLQAQAGWGQWPSCSSQLGLSGSPSGGSSAAASSESQQTQQAPQQQQTQQAPQQQTQQAPQQQEAPAQQQQTQQAPQQQEAPAQQQAPQQSYSAAGEVSAAPNTDVEVSDETYTVASGDSLSSIAGELGVDWQDLWGANADQIEDPNLIFVGDQLKLPVTN